MKRGERRIGISCLVSERHATFSQVCGPLCQSGKQQPGVPHDLVFPMIWWLSTLSLSHRVFPVWHRVCRHHVITCVIVNIIVFVVRRLEGKACYLPCQRYTLDHLEQQLHDHLSDSRQCRMFVFLRTCICNRLTSDTSSLDVAT